MGAYGRFPWHWVRRRWQRVRSTGHSRTGVALGGMGGERHQITLRSFHPYLRCAEICAGKRSTPREHPVQRGDVMEYSFAGRRGRAFSVLAATIAAMAAVFPASTQKSAPGAQARGEIVAT